MQNFKRASLKLQGFSDKQIGILMGDEEKLSTLQELKANNLDLALHSQKLLYTLLDSIKFDNLEDLELEKVIMLKDLINSLTDATKKLSGVIVASEEEIKKDIDLELSEDVKTDLDKIIKSGVLNS